MGTFERVCWIVTVLATVAAAFILAGSFAGAISAPQQGALAAIACGTALVPYVFARAVEALGRDGRERRAAASEAKAGPRLDAEPRLGV
jgi:hypothetical protein